MASTAFVAVRVVAQASLVCLEVLPSTMAALAATATFQEGEAHAGGWLMGTASSSSPAVSSRMLPHLVSLPVASLRVLLSLVSSTSLLSAAAWSIMLRLICSSASPTQVCPTPRPVCLSFAPALRHKRQSVHSHWAHRKTVFGCHRTAIRRRH